MCTGRTKSCHIQLCLQATVNNKANNCNMDDTRTCSESIFNHLNICTVKIMELGDNRFQSCGFNCMHFDNCLEILCIKLYVHIYAMEN